MARGQGGVLVVTDLWTISRGYRRILAWAAPILISCALGQLALADSSPNRTTIPSSDAFDILAEQILAGIEASDKLPAYESGARDDRPRIAVWPFSADNAPVPAGLANEYNAKLILALLDKGGDRYRFIARDTLEAVVKEISESGAHEDEIDDLLAALVKSAKADVLVVGKLRRATVREVVLSYEAVRVDDGTILAATSHHRIHIDPLEADTAWTPPTRDLATQADSRRHAKGAPEQTHLYLRDPEALAKIPPAPSPRNSYGTPSPLVVETVQEDLMTLGYDPGPVDGVLGARTAAAIRAYQVDSGLPVDRRISVRLVDSLRQSVERHIAARPRREPMASRPTLPIGYGSRRPFCREYEQKVMIGGIEQRGYGKACLQPDGVWKVVE